MSANPNVDTSLALSHGLSEEEYHKIQEILGRVPTFTELGVFSVMWSEHCSYKNSIAVLKTLPREGDSLLTKAGEENAGLVDIGNNLAIAFKIESHNHPSAVEPYQGAATGVGGIHRDIFTMGARPIATLNSLRFGNINDARVQYLLDGVVRGIGDYGNSFGVPTVGGEVYFDKCYSGNPLVNAMSVGILEHQNFIKAIAEGEDNPVLIVGSSTGRDGIHGATFASEELSEESEHKRPSVQVGDPFAEKLLLEATLEAQQTGLLVGVQDMGAAGITSSTSEMSARGIEKNGKGGLDINLDLVPTREYNMSAYEILLSESQERMLLVVKKGFEQQIIDIYEKWGLHAVIIGRVTSDNMLRIRHHEEIVVEIPAVELVLGGGAPVYYREAKQQKTQLKSPTIKPDNDIDFNSTLKSLLSSPNITSRHPIFNQYDSMVRTNTVTEVGHSDAAVVRIKDTNAAIAMTTDCNSRYVYLNPRKGGMIAVSECARNLACSGAKPLAITNCLNFGNPYNPGVYFQFKESVEGMGDACRKFDTPVTGGNVSFYNESEFSSKKTAIYPTPVIGMIGKIDDLSTQITPDFKSEGDLILLLGNNKNNTLDGSEYLSEMYDSTGLDAPYFNLEEEKALVDLMLSLSQKKLVHSAHDISEGGMVTALSESAIFTGNSNLGFHVNLNLDLSQSESKIQTELFSEAQGRILVSIDPNNLDEVSSIALKFNVTCEKIGTVIFDEAIFDINNKNVIKASMKDISSSYFNGLSIKLHQEEHV